jgi:tripartite-type tricarboxylate transporter receptor subunit TctC
MTIRPFVAAAALPAFAQTWPARPAKIVAPFPAGGPADEFAKAIDRGARKRSKVIKDAGVRAD